VNFRKEAVEKLRYYKLKKYSLQVAMEEYNRLGDEMAALHAASDGDRVTGGEGDREAVLISLIEKRDALSVAIKNTRTWIRVVDKAMAALGDDDRLILNTLYVEKTNGGINHLCERLFVEKTTVYRRRDRAIREFTIAMYGTEK